MYSTAPWTQSLMKLYFPYHPTHSLVDESALVAYVFRIVFFFSISSERKPTFKAKTSFFYILFWKTFSIHFISFLSSRNPHCFCPSLPDFPAFILIHIFILNYFNINFREICAGEKRKCVYLVNHLPLEGRTFKFLNDIIQ